MSTAADLIEQVINEVKMPADRDEMGDLWDKLEAFAKKEKLPQSPDFDDQFKNYVRADFLVDHMDKAAQKVFKNKLASTIGGYKHSISGPDKEGFISVKLFHKPGL